jgi:5-oxoprolinase (ATP-hydrolysing)
MACLIADTLGIKTIFLHPHAGVLSAYGMGLADIRTMRETSLDRELDVDLLTELPALFNTLAIQASPDLDRSDLQVQKLYLKYAGTDTVIPIDFNLNLAQIAQDFERDYRSRYGFIQTNKQIIVASISIELIQTMPIPPEPITTRMRGDLPPKRIATVPMFTNDQWYDTPIYQRTDLQPGDRIEGTAIIVESISTITIEPNWTAHLTDRNHLILQSIAT